MQELRRRIERLERELKTLKRVEHSFSNSGCYYWKNGNKEGGTGIQGIPNGEENIKNARESGNPLVALYYNNPNQRVSLQSINPLVEL